MKLTKEMLVYMGDQAVEEFIKYCSSHQYKKFLLIGDHNTYRVIGERVEKAIAGQGKEVSLILFNPEGLHADSESLAHVLANYDGNPSVFVAVGSGTLTDITRFTSHRSQNPFISFPTAASVDAYASENASVTIGGLKGSVYCQSPEAIFTHIPTICEAPRFLTASGFGDLMGKYTSSADWRFTNLIWGSEFDEDIYARTLGAGKKTRENADGIARQHPDAMEAMMEAHFETGLCMAEFGRSDPASGGEHHIAHIWEMMFQWEEKEGLFHGSAVGVAALMEAGWFDKLRELSIKEAEQLLETVPVPPVDVQKSRIRSTLPEIAGELIESEPFYIQMADPEVHKKIRLNILDRWDEIQEAASQVPPQHELRLLLKQVGGAVSGEDLGLTEKQVRDGMEFGHYLRERFSMNLVRKLFGW